ncbi:MAG: pyruvate kinase [bacterium]|nr:pyruvate kinase [bacterium]MDY2829876.1 pyruvate kinase [Alphaproteobacteria bacterium]
MPVDTHTKILATIGPSSATKEQISKLIDAGADAFRINFSHGTHAEHKERIKIIRQLEKEKGRLISILADLQGPKLRVGEFKEDKVLLKEGQKFTLDMNPEAGDAKRVCLPHKEIFAALKAGETLLVNDGYIALKVVKCDKKSAETVVKVGGYISSHKGVNLPNTKLNISAITEKDKEDLKFALKNDVDWIGLSFVQKAEDVREVKKLIDGKARVISKLEKPSAINDLENIVKESDAVMVARGDLGVECPIETVPVMQKRIVKVCRLQAKPVIVATQMLESMIVNPTPTRAEVSDVATAVYDGADTVMLSAETAAGKYPVEAVLMMHKIICQVENDPLFFELMNSSRHLPCMAAEADAITFAASELAGVLKNVRAIVSYSSSGFTTFLTARERPSLPILALSPDIKVARQLVLVWGVRPSVNKDSFKKFAHVEDCAVKYAKEVGLAKSGDHIIITAGFPLNVKGRTNMLHTVYVK